MPVDSDFVIGQLKKLGKDRKLKIQGDKGWICCPWHKSGREKTPSLAINLKTHPKFGAGSWTCFGCDIDKTLRSEGKGGGSWRNLAAKCHLETGDGKKVAKEAPAITKSELDLLDEELFTSKDEKQLEIESDRERLKQYPKHPSNRIWRTIPGKLVRKVGGIDAKNKWGYSRLYLPIKVDGEWCSGIYCTYTKSDKSYIYDGDSRVNKSLFPYDYIKKKLSKLKPKDRYIVLVEGPRDALHLIANGIYALAVLGGVKSWNKDKLKLFLDLDTTNVVIASDPDEVGDKLYRLARKDFRQFLIRCKRFEMDYEIVKKVVNKKRVKIKEKLEDPGSLSKRRIRDLKEEIEENKR